MAALQTLRNKPALLMSVIGGALLLFIITLTDLNSCSRPNVEGEVNGEELTYEDLEKQVRDEENLESLLLGSVEDSEKDNIRRNVWNDFVQQQAIATEAGKLGIVATKEDIQNELSGVTPQQLQQVAQMLQYGQGLNNVSYAQKIMLLMARYMGQPGVEAYKQFMKTVDQQIAQLQKQDPKSAEMLANLKQACLYCESRIPEEIVTNKYMGLIAQGATSNPISSKMDYEENTTTVGMEVVNVPYSTVADKDITITDSDLKAKYSACKEFFRTQGNTRDLKFIHVTVAASSSDRDNILAQVKSVEDSLRKASTAEEVEAIMRGAKSDVNFMNVYIPKSAYTESQMNDVVDAIDSLTVGGVLHTKLEAAGRDGVQYFSTYKMVGTKTTPDSMQICQFAVDSKEAADSIVAAVKAGSTLSAEAAKRPALTQKYGLKGDTAWNATKYYVDAHAADSAAQSAYTDVCQIPVGTTAYYTVPNQQTGGNIFVVTTVLSAKAPSAKYNMAIVKYPVKFTQSTYNDKRRALFEFLAKNKTLESLEKNAAKAGYTLTDRPGFGTGDAMEMRFSIGGEGVKQAFMWAFDEANAGEISQVYECGKDNDQLLVVAVSAVNNGKYLSLDNPTVKEQIRQLVLQDKKAEKILEKAAAVKDIAAAKKLAGASSSNQPSVPLAQMAAYEPAVAGAIERTAAGKFTGAVKGVNGIYLIQVGSKTQNGATYNEAYVKLSAARGFLSHVFSQRGSLLEALVDRQKVVDKRYKF